MNMSRMTKWWYFENLDFLRFLTLIRRCGTNVHTGTINGHTWTIYKFGPAIHAATVVLKKRAPWGADHRTRPVAACVQTPGFTVCKWSTSSGVYWSNLAHQKGKKSRGRAFTAIYFANCYSASGNMMPQILRFSVLSLCYWGHLAAPVYFQGCLGKRWHWHSLLFHCFFAIGPGTPDPIRRSMVEASALFILK